MPILYRRCKVRGKSLTGTGTEKVDVILLVLSHESPQYLSIRLEILGSVYIGHTFWSNMILLHSLQATHGDSKETSNKVS